MLAFVSPGTRKCKPFIKVCCVLCSGVSSTLSLPGVQSAETNVAGLQGGEIPLLARRIALF